MATEHDDLDAIRTVVKTLAPFEPQDQKRIIRWSCEKLGLTIESDRSIPISKPASLIGQPQETASLTQPSSLTIGSQVDIKSFLDAKNPTNDMQFAATVAYYYAFEAPESQRRESIGSDELQDACRLLSRERLHNPGQTLRNAVYNGLLDKSGERGQFKINTVGENLVAVTLPSGVTAPKAKASRTQSKKKTSGKKDVKKKKRKTGKKK
jgi:hypothetical protein